MKTTFKSLCGVLVLFCSFLLTQAFALVEVESKNFDLGAGVIGVRDKDSQELLIQGNGTIDKAKWGIMVSALTLDSEALNKLEFGSGVRLPDNSSYLFSAIKTANLVFPSPMDISNVVTANRMFFNNSVFTGSINFVNARNLIDAQDMFHSSVVREVTLLDTEKLQKMELMFFSSQVELVNMNNTSSVTTMYQTFMSAKNFRNTELNWDLSNVQTAYRMLHDTPSFTGTVTFTNARNLIDAQDMFHSSAIREVTLLDTEKLQNMEGMFLSSQVELVTMNNTSSVTNMHRTFSDARKFRNTELNRDFSNVKTAYRMLHNTPSFTGTVTFTNARNLIDAQDMFHSSAVREVTLLDTEKLQNMAGMFLGSAVELVNIDDTSSVTNMHKVFYNANKFRNTKLNWDLSSLETATEMFVYAWGFSGEVNFTNAKNLKDAREMFAQNNIKKVTILDTEKLQNMAGMFAFSAVEEVEMNNTSSVTNMNSTFKYAKKFNSDISHWDLSKVTDASEFIWETRSFDSSNYEAFLKMLDDSGMLAQGTPIDVSSTYCLARETRNNLILKGFDIKDRGIDCKLKIDIVAPTKAHSGDITDTLIKVSALLPLDPGKVRLTPTTNMSNTGLTCTHGVDETEVLCTVTLTSTNGGNRLEVLASLDVESDSWIKRKIDNGDGTFSYEYDKTTSTTTVSKTLMEDGYLIDKTDPGKGQIRIDTTNGIHTPMITLPSLPRDVGIGISHCVLKADAGEYDETNRLEDLSEVQLSLDDTIVEHSVWVKCYDKLGRFSENEVRFPPIVSFADNKVLRSEGTIQGKVSVYAPLNQDSSENLIDSIWAVDEYGSMMDVGLICVDYEGNTTSPYKNKPDQPIRCSFYFPFPGARDEFPMKIMARSQSGAEGWNTQSFFRDEVDPQITIEPDSAFTGGSQDFTFTFTVKIFDAVSMLNAKVFLGQNTSFTDINGGNSDITDLCKPLVDGDQNTLICSLTTEQEAKNGTLEIIATDEAGNEIPLALSTYTIDKTAPEIVSASMSRDQAPHKDEYAVQFSVQDAQGGAGLRTAAENFPSDVIQYGVSNSDSCTDIQVLGQLNPANAEPFDLSFSFNQSSHNGKYLCLLVKDKVGNLTSHLVSSEVLNVNVAPELANQKLSIDENKPVGTQVLHLQARDANNDMLTYSFTGENRNVVGETFEIVGDKLLVKGILDYEKQTSYQLTIQVQDEHGLIDTAEITININDLDEITPEISKINDQTAKRKREITPIEVKIKDNLKLQMIKVEGLPQGISYEKKSESLTEVILLIKGKTEVKRGAYPIKIVALDASGNQASEGFTLTVRNLSSGDDKNAPDTTTDITIDIKPEEKPDSPSNTTPEPEKETPQEEKKEEKADSPVQKYEDDEIYNPTIENGKCYNRRAYLGIKDSETITTSDEFKKALSFLRSYEMTMFDSVDGYAPRRNLSREEAAKIFSNFAINVLCRKPDLTLYTNYLDTANATSDLKPYIELAYQLGIMKGSGKGDGNFRPKDFISKAEVNAVLIRMILKSYLDESQSLWYSEYNRVATALGIITQGAGVGTVPRNDVALMLFRAYKNQVFDWRNVDYWTYVLENRGTFVK